MRDRRRRRRPGRAVLRRPHAAGGSVGRGDGLRAEPRRRHVRLRRGVLRPDARRHPRGRPRAARGARPSTACTGTTSRSGSRASASAAAATGWPPIARKTLLGLLQDRARDVGVDLRFSTEVALADLGGLRPGRGRRRRQLGDPRAARRSGSSRQVETATAKFIWFGTDYLFDGLTFVHERGPHGVFAVHGYPISDAVSTFIVETDEESWRAAGLDEFDVTQPPGPERRWRPRPTWRSCSPTRSTAHELLVNNSRWGNFRTRRTERWHGLDPRPDRLARRRRAHRALLRRLRHEDGDGGRRRAAPPRSSRTGTTSPPRSPPTRRPPSRRCEKIQGSARPSLSWWEHFGRYHDALRAVAVRLPLLLPQHHRRAPRAAATPASSASSHERWVAEHGAEPLDTPLTRGGADVPRPQGRRRRRRRSGPPAAGAPAAPRPTCRKATITHRGAGLASRLPTARTGCPPSSTRSAPPLPRRPRWSPSTAAPRSPGILVCEEVRLGTALPALLVDPGLRRRRRR